MKKMILSAAMALGVLGLTSGAAQAKVAFLDIKRAMDAHPATPVSLKTLAAFKKANYQKMSQMLNAEIKKRVGKKTPSQVSEAQRKEIQALSAQYEDRFEDTLNKKDLELTAPILKDIRAAATAIMKAKGYDAVLDRDAVFIGGDDITAQVVARVKAKK